MSLSYEPYVAETKTETTTAEPEPAYSVAYGELINSCEKNLKVNIEFIKRLTEQREQLLNSIANYEKEIDKVQNNIIRLERSLLVLKGDDQNVPMANPRASEPTINSRW